MSKLQEFFSKKWWLIVAPIVFFVGALGVDIFYMIDYAPGTGFYYLIPDIFVAVIALVVCLSFAKHNKNVMKALIGGLLMFICCNNLGNALENVIYFEKISDAIFSCTFAILSIAFFVIHLLLASNHKANAKLVAVNMIVGILFAVCPIIWELIDIIFFEENIIFAISCALHSIGLALLIMSIECNIDYFKQVRDEKELNAE